MSDPQREARMTAYRKKAAEIRADAESMSPGVEKTARLKVADGYDALLAQLKPPSRRNNS